jgi:hypothetical protein
MRDMDEWILQRVATLRSELLHAHMVARVLRKLPSFPYGSTDAIKRQWWECYMYQFRLVSSVQFSVSQFR